MSAEHKAQVCVKPISELRSIYYQSVCKGYVCQY